MRYKLSLASGEVLDLTVDNVYQAQAIGNRYHVNFELERVWTPEEAYRVWIEEKDLQA